MCVTYFVTPLTMPARKVYALDTVSDVSASSLWHQIALTSCEFNS